MIGSEGEGAAPAEPRRSSEAGKQAQLANLAAFEDCWEGASAEALVGLQQVALSGGNVFEELMETVKRASLGQVSQALFAVGGRYRRSM